jgi:hypothetical protein
MQMRNTNNQMNENNRIHRISRTLFDISRLARLQGGGGSDNTREGTAETVRILQVKVLDNANMKQRKKPYALISPARPISSKVVHVVSTLCDCTTSLLDLHVHAQVT